MRKLLLIFALLYAVANGGPEVKFWTEGDYRYCESNGIPDHQAGHFPNAHNPNTMSPQHHFYRMPLRPTRLLTPVYAAPLIFGVALNGVPFDPGTAERYGPLHYEALGGALDLGLDHSNAHVQPTGSYHYHGLPIQLIQELGGGSRMTLVGYAADGFPIYNDRDLDQSKLRSSFRLRKGARPGGGKPDGTFTEDYEWQEGELDLCNGHWGRTPEFPGGTYHYHLTENFPFCPRWFAGAPDPSFARR
jgi:hypothetical protein